MGVYSSGIHPMIKSKFYFMIIAVDFDGTCVTHEYPKVGQDVGAVPVLKMIISMGH